MHPSDKVKLLDYQCICRYRPQMTHPEPDELATPSLLRGARGVYTNSIRAELHSIGVDDLPRNGALVLTNVASGERPLQDLPVELGVTKQAVSQVIDILTDRGYLERSSDPEDRRRIDLALTERGHQVVEAVDRAVARVDLQLLEHVPAETVTAMRSALAALAAIKATALEQGAGKPRPARQLRQFSPIFPVSDLGAALVHYTALGFKTVAYPDGDDYGFANRDGIGLHLLVDHHHENEPSHHRAAAYLYVHDADALYEEWSRPGIGGETLPVCSTPYKLREGAHVDPDGNLIRFGSPMEE